MSDKRAWDEQKAASLDGALVLIGLTVEAPEGSTLSQFYGTVIEVDPRSGVLLRLEGTRSGETYRLPPDLNAFFPARPGEYRLRSIGEVVRDPDFTAQWTITPPSH
ncbi:MAG: hypothetical protein ACTHNN_02910 [Xanthobacteraceae bacterium]